MATFPLYGTGVLAQTRAGRKKKKRDNNATGFFMIFPLSDNCMPKSRVGGLQGMRFAICEPVDRHAFQARDDKVVGQRNDQRLNPMPLFPFTLQNSLFTLQSSLFAFWLTVDRHGLLALAMIRCGRSRGYFQPMATNYFWINSWIDSTGMQFLTTICRFSFFPFSTL